MRKARNEESIMTKYWTTLDGRTIPIKYMTTTHLANAMYHCDKQKTPSFKPPLLEEWALLSIN